MRWLKRALSGPGLGRSYSVVAWGSNTEGQCGVATYLPVLLQPREVEAFTGLPVAVLTAGKTHSAGVLSNGEVLTWGDGRDGKLGHGSTDSCHVPQCVESLAGRVHVVGAALGRQHTLFLDSSGQAWATGENKEGQCGLGTPLEELARQQRQQYEAAGALPGWRPSVAGGLAAAAASTSGGGAAAAAQQQQQQQQQQAYEQQQFQRSVEWFAQNAWQNTHLLPFVEHGERSSELETAVSMYDASMRRLVQQRSAWQRFEAAKGADIAIPGLMPGQIASPVRLGRARQGIFSPMLPELAGLDSERIVQLSAGRFMSASVTVAGEVWTFGGGFNGELGGSSGSSWSPTPRRVEGILAQVLKDNGGAVQVAAGGAFCVALTKSGRVVLWGQPRGSEALKIPSQAAVTAGAAPAATGAPAMPQRQRGRRRRPLRRPSAQAAPVSPAPAVLTATRSAAQAPPKLDIEQIPNLRLLRQPGMLVAEVTDLPPMTSVAAGFTHIAMTDGSSVWTIGRQGSPAASPSDGSSSTSGSSGSGSSTSPELDWLQPHRVMHQPDAGISSLAAGAFSTAAITGAGDLYLWGTILSEGASSALLKQSEEEGLGHWAYSSTADPAALQWSGWEGLGGPEPRRVPGLHKVQQVSLGTHHALAVVA